MTMITGLLQAVKLMKKETIRKIIVINGKNKYYLSYFQYYNPERRFYT